MCQIPQIRFQIYLVSSVLPIQFKTTSLVIKVIFNSFVNKKKKKKRRSYFQLHLKRIQVYLKLPLNYLKLIQVLLPKRIISSSIKFNENFNIMQ